MRTFLLTALLVMGASTLASQDSTSVSIGYVDLYGGSSAELEKVRASLSALENTQVASGVPSLKAEISQKVETAIGRAPSDVAVVCCDARKRSTIYVGVSKTQGDWFLAVPNGKIRLDAEAVRLSHEEDAAFDDAVEYGKMAEEGSSGFALSEFPRLRKAQLAINRYAMSHAPLLEKVLKLSSVAEDRAIAADFMGYTDPSPQQIRVLSEAAFDSNVDVRNNALRALAVLFRTDREAHATYVSSFIKLLDSGYWSDRNKASALLVEFTKKRDASVMRSLGEEARQPLLEGCAWKNMEHAYPFCLLLARANGMDEVSAKAFLQNGKKEMIMGAAAQKR